MDSRSLDWFYENVYTRRWFCVFSHMSVAFSKEELPQYATKIELKFKGNEKNIIYLYKGKGYKIDNAAYALTVTDKELLKLMEWESK